SYWAYGQVITDKSKRLYVATNQGLLRFNYQKQKFDRILTGNIGSIAAREDGTVWIIRDNKLQSFHPDKLPTVIDYPQLSNVSTLISTKEHIYVALAGKVYKLNTQTKKYILFADLGNPNYVIRDLVEHDGAAYILTLMNGLYECDALGKIRQHYNLSFGSKKSTSAKGLYLDATNTLWIATQSGLFLLDPVKKGTHLLRSNLHYPYSLPNNSVWSIYPDPDGGIWIGTYGGKLAYMTFFDNDVNYFKPTLGGLNHPIVSCFEEDAVGNLWIGTEGGCLNYWNRKNDHFSYYTHSNKTGITSNMIKNMHYDKKHNI